MTRAERISPELSLSHAPPDCYNIRGARYSTAEHILCPGCGRSMDTEKSRMAKKKEAPYREYEAELKRRIAQADFPRVTLICGEQDLLRAENARKLREAALGGGDAMNCTVLRGNQVTAAQIIDLAETLPFCAERRVITVEESVFFTKPGGEADRLAAYMERIPGTTCLIFAEPSPNASCKLYRAIAKNGFIMKCDTPDEGQLRSWTAGLFTDAGFRMDGGTLALFLEGTGTDMLQIRSEAEKLIGYCLGRSEITAQDVRAVCTPPLKDRIFDMVSAVTGGRQSDALAIYMDLKKLQTPPQVILSLLVRQYTQLLEAGELLQTMSEQETASMLKLSPWVLSNRLRPALRGTNRVRLENALEACVRADEEYKNGRISPELAVEELIVRLSAGR